jgi:membrane protease YdiL (CAAX protease family)
MQTPKPGLKPLVIFLVLTVLLSSLMYCLLFTGRGGSYGVMVLMWCPSAAAIITSLFYHRNLLGMGWKWGQSRWYALAYFLPIICPSVAYGLVWITGLGGLKPDFSPVAPFVGPTNIFVFAIVGSLWNLISATGEEIGWRGFLVPRLRNMKLSFTAVALISGAVWAVWHFPFIISGPYNQGGPVWYSLLMFSVQVLASGTIMAWLRLKSGSLWPATFAHASNNLWIQSFFDPITVNRGVTNLLTGEFGIVTTLTTIIAALILWKLRNHLPQTEEKPGSTVV